MAKFIARYPEVSIDWLITGNGSMIKSAKEEPKVVVKPIHQPRSVEKKEDTQVVYLYDFEASAGLRSLFENNKQNIIDTIKIPNLPKCDGAIHIVGDSMYPLLKSGDIILYKQMPLDMQNLLYGEMYLLSYDIDGDDYIVVKYIRKSDKGEPFITLGSENPEHASRDIDFRRVSALALVKASVRINCMI
ncbi:MAG: S24 family peptidase [Bacteroidaceae bacterium]|nr:S24 family peptidase [Bacteroidaceae bacterium]